jgi:cell division protein ZipA
LITWKVILILMFIESRSRRKPDRDELIEKSEPIVIEPESIKKTTTIAPKKVRDLLVISIIAKPYSQFASYDLLQAIYATGMQFGDMNIFHYYQLIDNKKIPIFSLASATEPGDFNLDKMGDYSCHGLTLFTDLRQVPSAQLAFEKMYHTALQLAEDLDGELRAGHLNPWNADVLKQYRQIAASYVSVMPANET